MGQDFPPSQLSLYLHIPFCLTRCGYCSFFSVPYDSRKVQNYVSSLSKELELYADILRQPLHTLYLGGGTPSLLNPGQINSLVSQVRLEEDAEITLEINPLQITPAYLEGLRHTPVNRLSIGLQSMHNDELQWLDRRHKAEDIPSRIALCREYGYSNLSLDMIYGLPLGLCGNSAQAMYRLQQNLERFIQLQADHLSCYLLSLDDRCRISQTTLEVFRLPHDSLAARQYQLIRSTLRQAGYQHYEISNFARPGKESRHNLVYWQGENYLAAGASAAGFIAPRRYQNPANVDDYYLQISKGIKFPQAQQQDDELILQDAVMMGLRLIKGIDLARFNRQHNCNLLQLYAKKIEQLNKQGLLKLQRGRLALKTKALFISNYVIGELLA